jgi:hypothetical protein
MYEISTRELYWAVVGTFYTENNDTIETTISQMDNLCDNDGWDNEW